MNRRYRSGRAEGYKWSLAQGLYITLDPLLLFQIEPEISTPEKSAFATERFGTY